MPKYRFSAQLKHPDVKLMNETWIRSTSGSKYKFAIMEPGLEHGKPIKKLYFKIKVNTSDWIAVGMCHKKIIQAKNYDFTFSNTGHGAYMISSNAGTWSNINGTFNNVVKVKNC